jgi:hypothetical protein
MKALREKLAAVQATRLGGAAALAEAQQKAAAAAAADQSALESKRKVELEALRNKKSSLDLCFVMDCTASMGPSIDAARAKINEVVASVRSEFQGLVAFNIAFVAYRDYGDTPQHQVMSHSLL